MQNTLKTISSHALALRIAVVAAACALLLAIPAFVQLLTRPDIVYQPVNACTLLTTTIAKEILGDNVINRRSAPTIDTDTGVATSKCSYSDINDTNMSIVAVAVQTGINDTGVDKLKNDFIANEKANTTEKVDGIGAAAFFNPVNGQLHVRDEHHWYIFNRSSGDDPANTSKDGAIDFAKRLLNKDSANGGQI